MQTLLFIITAALAWFSRDFRIDASADTLVNKHDKAIQYAREIASLHIIRTDFSETDAICSCRELADPTYHAHPQQQGTHGPLSRMPQQQELGKLDPASNAPQHVAHPKTLTHKPVPAIHNDHKNRFLKRVMNSEKPKKSRSRSCENFLC